jgi:hypothetical protein
MLALVVAVRDCGAVLLCPWSLPGLDSRNVGVDLRGTLLRGRDKQFKAWTVRMVKYHLAQRAACEGPFESTVLKL